MTVTVERARELAGGTLLALLGGGAALKALTSQHIGTPANMGPGFFPVVLGICLALCGLGVAAAALGKSLDQAAVPRVNVRAVALVTLSVALFALTIRPLGMVPAAFLLVLAAGFADPRTKPLTLVLLAGGLAAISWLVFIVALGMPLRAFAF